MYLKPVCLGPVASSRSTRPVLPSPQCGIARPENLIPYCTTGLSHQELVTLFRNSIHKLRDIWHPPGSGAKCGTTQIISLSWWRGSWGFFGREQNQCPGNLEQRSLPLSLERVKKLPTLQWCPCVTARGHFYSLRPVLSMGTTFGIHINIFKTFVPS